MSTNEQQRQHEAQERQARTMQAMKDFFHGATRSNRQPGRTRPAEWRDGLFSEDQDTGARA